ncbi:MAG: trigger factor [Bacillus sp. (in: Bacteria)]|nr:trigger factor [Bacillus sp. (in: firmicutes)]MCM1426200.1 trigger factor [Eubacterium sp.]
MKKRITLLMAATFIAGILSACGKDVEYISQIKASDYVTLGTYKGIEITVSDPEIVTQKNMADSIADLELMNGITVPVTDRTLVEEGDTVNIDYAGYRDGVAFEGGTAAGQDLTIGSGSFIPGFEDGLIGKKVGETVSLDLTFPENYRNTEMAGAAVTFEVTINSISIIEPQELTDDFIKELTQEEYVTVEDFESYLYDYFYVNAASAYETEVTGKIAQTVMAGCIFETPPEEMVERYCNMQIEDMTNRLAEYGVDLNTYMQAQYGMDPDAYMQMFREDAAKVAQQYIMFQAIADAEELNLTKEEMAQAMEQHALSSGYESVEAFKEEIGEEIFYEYQMAENVMDFLEENAEIHME